MDRGIVVDKRLQFVGVLFGIPKRSMVPRNTRSKVQSVGKLWDLLRKMLTTHGRTEAVIDKAMRRSKRIYENVKPPDSIKVSVNDKRHLKLLIFKQLSKFRHPVLKSRTMWKIPQHRILAKLALQFIKEWNACIQNLDGHWLFKYGIVESKDLTVSNLSDLINIGETALKQKILKNFFLMTDREEKQKYLNSKQLLTTLIVLLKLDGILQLQRLSHTQELCRRGRARRITYS